MESYIYRLNRGAMLDIVYDPEVDSTEKRKYVLLLNWNHENHDVNSLNINSATIYQDMRIAKAKIAGLLASWIKSGVVKIYMCIPHALVTQKRVVVEHVIVSIINAFFPNSHMAKIQLIIVHKGSYKKSDTLNKVIDKAKKIVGARMFAMLPSNVATPLVVATTLKQLFEHVPQCSCRIIEYDELKMLGFGLILGVGDSANNKPCLLIVERRGAGSHNKTVAIAGKGITFDSGGLAIKTYHGMVDMKYDKIGAVYGASALINLMEADELKHINFVGAFPLAENAVSGSALNPGDVIRSYNGKTVEVVNPDAEGRLVLADAFGFLEIYKPDLLIDVATLTGHASSINCWHCGYYYCNDKYLCDYIRDVTDDNGERMLPMPTWEDYDDVLHSDVADYANSPLKCSDSFVATLFLKQFVPKKCKWVHIDLAHEFETGCPPRGNGIRTIIDIVEHYFSKTKKK